MLRTPPPQQLTQVIRYFLQGRSGTGGLHTSHTPGHDHSATPSPSPARLCHIWLRRPGTLSFPPFSKCTSGSHLTPVRPNFHFQGRCGFQIIYHFPKCFHMCAGFPSVQSSCLRPNFSKCIKIQFAPKKFRHWCFTVWWCLVIISLNYSSGMWLDRVDSMFKRRDGARS